MTDAKRPSGLAVDSSGGPVIDPTANVRELVEQSIKRLDDMLTASERRIDQVRVLERQRNDDLRSADAKRLDDLRAAESRRIDEQQKLIADFHEKLSLAESKRIDAIRAVDVGAVAVASERAGQQATVLANQVAASADALRSLVATTADTMAKAQTALTTQFNERIATLEKSSYTGQGRSAYADPMIAELTAKMDGIAKAQSTNAGKTEGISASWGVLVAVVTMVIALVAIGITLITENKPSTPSPQVVYVPAQAPAPQPSSTTTTVTKP